MGFGEGKEIFHVASNRSCEKWILGRLSKNILGCKKNQNMHRKLEKVLSQFPAQLTLNSHLFNESTQAGRLYSLCPGRNRAGLLEPVTGSGPCFSLHFYPWTSQKGNLVTRDVWQTAQPIGCPTADSSCPIPNHDPWHVHRARKNVTKAILVSRWNHQKANKHSPSPTKNKSGWRPT